jgi:hypothetical protein
MPLLDIVVAHYNSLAFSEILSAFPKETTNILIYDKSNPDSIVKPVPNRSFCSFFSTFYTPFRISNPENVSPLSIKTPSKVGVSNKKWCKTPPPPPPLPTLSEIIAKYSNVQRIPRENKGREGETYLSHIIDNYDSLAEYTMFIQDDTDQHLPRYDYFIQNTNITMQHKQPFYSYQCSWRKGYNPFYRMFLNGIPEPGLQTLSSQDAVLQATLLLNVPLPTIYITDICAFFIVSRDRIRARPVTFYQDLREWLLADEANGFVLEHIWQLIFTCF